MTEAAADEGEGVGGPHTSEDVGERLATGPGRAEGGPCRVELQEGDMSDAPTPQYMSTKLLKVTERAKWDPRAQMRSIVHVIDQDLLMEAFGRIRKDAAVGVDGVTKE
jgi:hypothetical protein